MFVSGGMKRFSLGHLGGLYGRAQARTSENIKQHRGQPPKCPSRSEVAESTGRLEYGYGAGVVAPLKHV